uniref:Sphingomyelin phosphodiesterase acid like 3A n=1 Tax=Cyprinus carpio TaxID=7962 RepID=A0A8C2FT46_CYPCA
MKQADLQPEFIIWTGPPHVPKEELSTYVVINLPVYPALGNHDYWPQVFQSQGLNTNLYYSPNQVTVNMTDPTGQFQWLQETLELSRQKMEMVSIFCLILQGILILERTQSYHEQLVKIFHNYSDFVKAQFYGHTHRDSASSKCYCIPFNNHSLSLFFPPKDIWQFYLNLTEANLKQRSKWKLEYIMTEAFDIDDIQLHSLHELALSKVFDKYFNNFMVSYNLNLTCEGLCKMIRVCALHFLDQETYSHTAMADR